MRAQVHAADVTCRAPGCVQHAPYTQLDHVIAYRDGGPTGEANLPDLHSRHHQDKTEGRPATGIDGRGEPRAQTPLTREAAHADAVDRAVYRALTYRGPARPLRAGDDHPDSDTDPGSSGGT